MPTSNTAQSGRQATAATGFTGIHCPAGSKLKGLVRRFAPSPAATSSVEAMGISYFAGCIACTRHFGEPSAHGDGNSLPELLTNIDQAHRTQAEPFPDTALPAWKGKSYDFAHAPLHQSRTSAGPANVACMPHAWHVWNTRHLCWNAQGAPSLLHTLLQHAYQVTMHAQRMHLPSAAPGLSTAPELQVAVRSQVGTT